MNTQELFRYIDHTLLKPYANWMEIDKLCREGLAYHTASVCIPPSFVARAREAYPTLRIGTVIGFPLGYQTTVVKVAEAVDAVGNGADELDLVINLGWVKENAFAAVTAEIIAVKAVIGQCLLKVIIETCYLSDAEKQQLCDCVAQSGADFIKTSTGFGSAGAAIADIYLFRQYLPPTVGIKAAGGIKTLEELQMFIDAGCGRIGTSVAVKLLNL